MVNSDAPHQLKRYARSNGQHSLRRIIEDIEQLNELDASTNVTVDDAAYAELQAELFETITQLAHDVDAIVASSDTVETPDGTTISLPNAKLENPFDQTKLDAMPTERSSSSTQ